MRTIIKSSRTVIVLILLFFPGSIFAIPVDDLFVAEVLVTDESPAQLNRGARAGLLQVLVRVAGTTEVDSSNAVRNALGNPSSYYNQYSYESTDKTLLVDGEYLKARILKIHFDPAAVAKLLRQAAFPVWGSNRPGVLLWLVISDHKGRRILGEADTGEIVQQLENQAKLRGLPLLFPLLDVEDASRVGTAEIWGAFLERVDDASERYNPDCILTGRLRVDNQGAWYANWSYRIDKEWNMAEDVSFSSGEIVQTMVARLANALSERYALHSSRDVVIMQVKGVNDLQDYAGVSRYLSSLAPVLDNVVLKVSGDQVEFRLSIEGQRTQLVDLIELDRKLTLISSFDNVGILHYRWLP